MANPNSAGRDAQRKEDRRLAKLMADDTAKASAKATKGPKVGTAADPVNEGAPAAGPAPSTHNRTPEWIAKLNEAASHVGEGLAATQRAWFNIGRQLVEIRDTFDVAGGGNDKRKFGEWIADNSAQLDKRLTTSQSRSEAMWFAENFEVISKLPTFIRETVLRYSNPTHIHSAFSTASKIAKAAKSDIASIGEDDEVAYGKAAEYSKGSTAPTSAATKDRFFKQFEKQVRENLLVEGIGVDHGVTLTGLAWQLRGMLSIAMTILSEENTENGLLKYKLEAAEATIAALRAKIEAGTGEFVEADFEPVTSEETAPQARPALTVLALPAPDKPKAKPAKAKKVKAKAKPAKKGKAKAKGQDRMDELAAKAKAKAKPEAEAPSDAI